MKSILEQLRESLNEGICGSWGVQSYYDRGGHPMASPEVLKQRELDDQKHMREIKEWKKKLAVLKKAMGKKTVEEDVYPTLRRTYDLIQSSRRNSNAALPDELIENWNKITQWLGKYKSHEFEFFLNKEIPAVFRKFMRDRLEK